MTAEARFSITYHDRLDGIIRDRLHLVPDLAFHTNDVDDPTDTRQADAIKRVAAILNSFPPIIATDNAPKPDRTSISGYPCCVESVSHAWRSSSVICGRCGKWWTLDSTGTGTWSLGQAPPLMNVTCVICKNPLDGSACRASHSAPTRLDR
jgi:hypothetical protein